MAIAKLFLATTCFLFTSLTALAQTAPQFNMSDYLSVEELETASPFDPAIQSRTLAAILAIKSIASKSDVAAPVIVVSELVADARIIKAMESQGMPAWALAKGINIYLFDLNIIILGQNMKVHNLAHELTHFIQVRYENASFIDGSSDYLEMDAIKTQNLFKSPN